MSTAVVTWLWVQFIFPHGQDVVRMNLEDIPILVRLSVAIAPPTFF
jgi:hypothetical protein